MLNDDLFVIILYLNLFLFHDPYTFCSYTWSLRKRRQESLENEVSAAKVKEGKNT